jgi:hypothetical protein
VSLYDAQTRFRMPAFAGMTAIEKAACFSAGGFF